MSMVGQVEVGFHCPGASSSRAMSGFFVNMQWLCAH